MKLSLPAKILAIVGLVCAATSPSQSANIVANHSFETGDFSGWTNVDASGFSGVDDNALLAEDGSHYAYLGAYPNVGSLNQNLTTSPGSYLSSLILAGQRFYCRPR